MPKGIYKRKEKKVRELIIKKDHALVPLTQGKFAIIDLDDIDKIEDYNWYCFKQNKYKNNYYARANIDKKYIFMHSIIKPTKKGFINDHINRNGLDNRKQNLREATISQNRYNSKSVDKTSIYKGVGYYKWTKKYLSRIGINHKIIHLGYFENEIDAAKVYDQAAIKYFGEFACTNEKLGLY